MIVPQLFADEVAVASGSTPVPGIRSANLRPGHGRRCYAVLQVLRGARIGSRRVGLPADVDER